MATAAAALRAWRGRCCQCDGGAYLRGGPTRGAGPDPRPPLHRGGQGRAWASAGARPGGSAWSRGAGNCPQWAGLCLGLALSLSELWAGCRTGPRGLCPAEGHRVLPASGKLEPELEPHGAVGRAQGWARRAALSACMVGVGSRSPPTATAAWPGSSTSLLPAPVGATQIQSRPAPRQLGLLGQAVEPSWAGVGGRWFAFIWHWL